MKLIWEKLNNFQFPDRYFHWALLLIAFLAMSLMIYLVYWGEPILSRDTVLYVELMKYYEFHGKLPMVWYVSSLPFILYRGAGMITGMSIVNTMCLVNCLCFGATVFLTGLTAKKIVKSSEMALACALLYAFLPKIVEINTSLLRESCAICFVLATLFFCVCAFESRKTRYFFGAAFFGLAAGFCRIELFELQIIIGITMLVMLFIKEWSFLSFMRNALSYAGGLICALVVIACLLGGTLEEYKNIPDIIIFRCRASSKSLEKNTHVPDYYNY